MTNKKHKKSNRQKTGAYFNTIIHNKSAQKFYQPEIEVAADDPANGVYTRPSSLFSYVFVNISPGMEAVRNDRLVDIELINRYRQE